VCRVYRYGQQRPTYIYRLVVDNSMERSIFNRQIGKSGLQQRVVDDHHIDANVTQRELETLLIYDEALDVRSDDWDTSEWEIDDEILAEIAAKLSRMFAQVPFLHESLMLEREDAMSEQEKLEARLLYERERQQFGRTAAIDETILSGSSAGMGRLGLPNERLWAGPQLLPFNLPGYNRPSMGNSFFAADALNSSNLRSEQQMPQRIIIDRELSLPDCRTRAFVQLRPGMEVWPVKIDGGAFLRLSDGQLLDAKNSIFDRTVPDYFGGSRGLAPFQQVPPASFNLSRQPIAEVVISDSE